MDLLHILHCYGIKFNRLYICIMVCILLIATNSPLGLLIFAGIVYIYEGGMISNRVWRHDALCENLHYRPQSTTLRARLFK